MDQPMNLGDRGLALYASYASTTTDPARLGLALEAARMSDRLDELDNIIAGKGVLQLMQFRVLDKELDPDMQEFNINVEVKFQSVLGEARQYAIALSGILKTLGLPEAVGQKTDGKEKPKKPVTGRTALEEKRAARDAQRKAAGQ